MAVVDVVVAASDPGPYLRTTLRSMIAQTRQDWRLIVMDDDSTEDLSWVADLDPRIQLIRRANRDVGVVRSQAISAGGAPCVAFLDADDVWLPAKLARQLAVTEAGPDIVLRSPPFTLSTPTARSSAMASVAT